MELDPKLLAPRFWNSVVFVDSSDNVLNFWSAELARREQSYRWKSVSHFYMTCLYHMFTWHSLLAMILPDKGRVQFATDEQTVAKRNPHGKKPTETNPQGNKLPLYY